MPSGLIFHFPFSIFNFPSFLFPLPSSLFPHPSSFHPARIPRAGIFVPIIHFFALFSHFLWSIQKKVVTLQSQTLQRQSGAPDTNQHSVCGGESGAPEDFNEPVGTEGSVGVRGWRTRVTLHPQTLLRQSGAPKGTKPMAVPHGESGDRCCFNLAVAKQKPNSVQPSRRTA